MKNQKGITLVALVITIIVLLILAGVSISLVVGDNGILTKATASATATDTASAESAIQLSVSTLQTTFTTDVLLNNYNAKISTWLSEARLNEELEKNGYQICTAGNSTKKSSLTDFVSTRGLDVYITKKGGSDANIYKVTLKVASSSDRTVEVGAVTLQ